MNKRKLRKIINRDCTLQLWVQHLKEWEYIRLYLYKTPKNSVFAWNSRYSWAKQMITFCEENIQMSLRKHGINKHFDYFLFLYK